jgi:zinc protease
MNLREDKHWSYGADTFLFDARGERPFLAIAPVQTDKSKEAVLELLKELREIRQQRPVTAEELSAAQSGRTLRLPGSFETLNRLASGIAEIVTFGLPDDYFESYVPKVRALTVDQVNAVARKLLRPEEMVWVIVGDRQKIEAGIRELDLGPVLLLDADGNPLETSG